MSERASELMNKLSLAFSKGPGEAANVAFSEVLDYVAKLEAKHLIGVQMANVIYNCSQESGPEWDEAKVMLGELLKKWDAIK